MVIFVTDVGQYWNDKNPLLEKYAENVVMVCIKGKKVTDKYNCVVVKEKTAGLGMLDYSTLSVEFQGLKKMKEILKSYCLKEENIVFLADSEPQSLYPYVVLKDELDLKRIHLWCIKPLKFEARYKNEAYEELLQDISKIHSLCHLELNMMLRDLDRKTILNEFNEYVLNRLNLILPSALYEIENTIKKEEKYYFDIKKCKYIRVTLGYEEIIKSNRVEELSKKECIDEQVLNKEVVESLYPRVDGKTICGEMKKMRIELANANDIPYEPVECPSMGACAGTCSQCDKELKYLQEQLEKIPREDRIYPEFKIINKKYFRKNDMEKNHMMLGYLTIFNKKDKEE